MVLEYKIVDDLIFFALIHFIVAPPYLWVDYLNRPRFTDFEKKVLKDCLYIFLCKNSTPQKWPYSPPGDVESNKIECSLPDDA